MSSIKAFVRGRFNVSDLADKLDPAKDMRLDRSNLNEEFTRQAGLAASYGYVYAEAEAEASSLEFKLARVHAEVDKEVRINLFKEGSKATEKIVENLVIMDERYIETKEELIEARKNKRVLKAACDALDHKLQALINAGATDRKNHEVIIKDDGFV